MLTKKCGKCQQVKPIAEYYPHKRDGYQSVCKECKRELSRIYNRTPRRREYNRQKYQEWTTNGGEQEYKQRPEVKKRKLAIARANQKKRSGKITPRPCGVCGASNSQMHHDNYDNPLTVRWLCPLHHTEEHLKLKAEGR